MSEIKLFIAASLDGFIAREDGGLDWLPGSDPTTEDDSSDMTEHDDTYDKFIAGIDILIMGRKTYEEVLSFGIEWPYKAHKSYVATSDISYKTSTENTFTLNKIDQQVIDDLKTASQKNIWLVGGGGLITQFLNLNALDEITINVVSVILGKGIRLFQDNPRETKFDLIESKPLEPEMILLTYRKKS